jgi:hypothetical protein
LYDFHKMDLSEYSTLREMSDGLFKNRLVVPVSLAILGVAEEEGAFTAPEIRRALDGRVESNQIRDALSRIEACGAIEELPFPGPPHPHTWTRVSHPFWDFVAKWTSGVAVRPSLAADE